MVPSAADIVTFLDPPLPEGRSPWVPGAAPSSEVRITDPDPLWPDQAADLMARIRGALGARVLRLEHVGSTAVPLLPAKPIIDLDLTLADPADEAAYVPPLTAAGFRLIVREPWWYEHRMLRADSPRANLHVFGPDSPEPWRHELFREHLRGDATERGRYAEAKRAAAASASAAGEHVEEYNARKQQVLREIYGRAFRAAGLLPD
jgi:GrpB-like predicted nucleotidyltransferase (UPF0157 family)